MEILEELKEEEFDEVYQILENSFPPDERRTYEEQKSLLEKDGYSIKIIRDEKFGNIKAFISVYEFENYVYAEHFAVSNTYRNQGLGAEVLRKLMQIYDKTFCLEVEPPTNEMPKRRIGFYEREGFVYNDYYYVQPAYSDEKNPVELRIMSYGKPLTFDEFKEVEATLYKEVYNCV